MSFRWSRGHWLFPLFGLMASSCGLDDTNHDTTNGDVDWSAPDGSTSADLSPAWASLRVGYIQSVQNNAPEEYAVVRSDEVLQAVNGSQGIRADFRAEEVRIAGLGEDEGKWSWDVSPARWGCAGDLMRIARVRPEASGNRVEYRHPGMTEWYVNGPLGVEQGFTVPDAPACRRAGGGELTIELRPADGLTPALSRQGREAVLLDEAGQTVLRYTDLHVNDAVGKALPAWLALEDGRLSIRIDDAEAVYPLSVDPLIVTETDKLLVPDGGTGDRYGYSLAVSGNTAFVGAPFSDVNGSSSGSVYVFVRSDSTSPWTLLEKLFASDGTIGDQFGTSLSVSGDTLVVGAPYADNTAVDSGAAYVFVWSGSTWSEQDKLIAGDGTQSDRFGTSVAISSDVAIVGAPGDKSAYIFTRSGGAWSSQKILPSSGSSDGAGNSVAISGDTAVVGQSSTYSFVWVFVRSVSSNIWVEQQILDPPSGVGNIGDGVAISGDTLVTGVSTGRVTPSVYVGTADVFTRSGSTWTHQQTLSASDGEPWDYFGRSVAFNGDRIVIGAPEDDDNGSNSGSIYVFTRSGSTWTQLPKVLSSNGAANDKFGSAVAISGDALLAGAYQKITNGAAYAFSFALGNGDVCAAADECASGFCVDGVCCDGACGGGAAGDCQACNLAGLAGTCSLAGASMVCRAAASECDMQEVCSGSSATCPADVNQPDGTGCTGGACSAGVCLPTVSVDPWQVAAGQNHSLAVDWSFDVWSWGSNSNGQLGATGITSRSAPEQVAGVSNVQAIAGGGTHSMALDWSNMVWTWGANTSGQLGITGVSSSSTPVNVGLIDVKAIAGGGMHSMALDWSNTVWTWGANSSGQLGRGVVSPNDPNPAPVTFSGGIGLVDFVAAGGSHSMALDVDGVVWTWGKDLYGQLGDGPASQQNQASPVPVSLPLAAIAIAAGSDHSMALLSDYTIWAWGRNTSGQLGDNSTINRPSPVAVVLPNVGYDVPVLIAAGASHSMAVFSNGDVYAWGLGTTGQLGNGTTANKLVPEKVGAIANVFLDPGSLAAGGNHSLAVASSNGAYTAWAWGQDSSGQLGNGTPNQTQMLPVPVSFP